MKQRIKTDFTNLALPFARPLYVMLKPVGAQCNLACNYCYYSRSSLITHHSPLITSNNSSLPTTHHLSLPLLEEFTRQYLEAQTMPQVLFTWHGGEPLLRPLAFYRKALELQQEYAHGLQTDNCIQTNGTLLTDEWCEFLRENNFLVGISIDGPQEMHDTYRRTKGEGKPTWESVMHGITLLKKHGVQWNAMAAVNAANVSHPVEFYHFFRDIGCEFLQFTPVVEVHGGTVDGASITPAQWGSFLCAVYDQWVRRDVGTLFVQLFDATLANWVGEPPGLCSMSPTCGHAAVMEADGTVYSCDHFVFPEYHLGNIREQTLTAMLYGERQRDFGLHKRDALPRQCRECRFLFACHGECPKNRLATDRYGEPGLNYLCEGYHRFFSHVANDMDFMARELHEGRPPANIMITNQKLPCTTCT